MKAPHKHITYSKLETLRSPPFRALWYYIACARLGGIGEASRRLNITQPAVTRQVSIIEDLLKIKLFIKDGKSTRLTRDGEILASKIEGPLFHLFDVWNQFSDASFGTSSAIELRCLPTFARYYLIPIIAQNLVPTWQDQFVVKECKNQTELLENPNALVFNCDKTIPDGWNALPLFNEEITMLASAKYVANKSGPAVILDFKNDHHQFDCVQDWIRKTKLSEYEQGKRLECDSYETALHFAFAGRGEILGCLNLFRMQIATGVLSLSSKFKYKTELKYHILFHDNMRDAAENFHDNLIKKLTTEYG